MKQERLFVLDQKMIEGEVDLRNKNGDPINIGSNFAKVEHLRIVEEPATLVRLAFDCAYATVCGWLWDAGEDTGRIASCLELFTIRTGSANARMEAAFGERLGQSATFRPRGLPVIAGRNAMDECLRL
ncbi:MAG TPA: hypothetical protein VHX20_14820 [Terracidiphilus sp.]|nr:hypothetical protein [Terracidiphilus sp.]